ncbi:DNA mismatch repair protein MutS [Natronomonas sp. EA1]|uniref:DNA mismatch repair protein MutS n=1 Tax=Natronomonas sp. EA1 TaxID=3421655 RepID=UPI003EC129E4
MDDALGAPAKMAERREDLTPMLSQYLELCERYDDCLVLFQVGDFYEAFCEAAETIARLLEITLTKREDSTGRYPMAGIPIDSAESYIETLLDAGYRVAVADQVEDATAASGLVDRAVTRVVTPGTLTEDELLPGDDNTFVAALAGPDPYGLAMLDVSTGDFYVTGSDSGEAIRDEIGRFGPAEAVIEPRLSSGLFDPETMVTPFRPDAFERSGLVDSYFGDPETLLATEAEIRACGALLAYAEYTRGAEGDGEVDRLDYLTHLTRYDPREYMLLDPVAIRSLEVFERRGIGGEADATLAGVTDETACALGRRRLTDWLRRPLLDPERIAGRHDAVGELARSPATRETVHDLLRDVYDLERLISRVSRGRANARDLRSLAATLGVVPDVREALADCECARLRELHDNLDPVTEVRELVDRAIAPEPPIELTEGGLIREGYDGDLDTLRATEREGKAWIDSLQERERERTGIDSLKVGFNQVHGYYIEVTNPNLDAVPEDYQRRQTLKNSERFVTPELKEREEEIVRAEGRADELEYDLFCEVRERVGEAVERVQRLADALSRLDALQSFATVAAEHGYARPELGHDGVHIEGGRHPVVERTQPSFVPNPTDLSQGALAVITGPNMAGKSTYMRQVALIQILAQAGAFVPASEARLPVVDRVFTRVGASDDIAGGRSTFMVEMSELSTILSRADEDSLVLLDEVGRGTSTADGLAIARAVTEYLHDEVGATTLFATHHHALTETAERLPRATNLRFEADGTGETVTFDHRVEEGAATGSYGIEVARSAGVPDAVVARARELLEGNPRTNGHRENGHRDDVRERLDDVDLAETTPLEAFEILRDLKN